MLWLMESPMKSYGGLLGYNVIYKARIGVYEAGLWV